MARVKKEKEEELNEYERQRQANIAKNKALLQELQLNAASAGLGLSKKPAAPKPSKSSASNKRKASVKKEDIAPRRTSSRIAGIEADSEVAKRKAEDDYVAIQQAERAKRQRINGDLQLGDIVVNGKDWDRSNNFLVDVVKGPRYEKTFTDKDVKETGDKELRALRERMNGMNLYEGFEPNQLKIAPERIYSMAFHPTRDKPLVLAGDKMGNLGIFDASQNPEAPANDGDDEDEDGPEPEITTFHLHARTISSIWTTPSTIYTSSYDSTIRALDLTTSASTTSYTPIDDAVEEPISGVQIPLSSPHLLYFSTLNGLFGSHDTRSSSTSLYTLSEKKIGGFSAHPLQDHYIATASLDRTLKLWDLRYISGRGSDKVPACVGEHESRLSVSHAAFNAAGQIATTSYDDTIKIHALPSLSTPSKSEAFEPDPLEPISVIKHNNQTGRWVTILRPQWQEQPQDGVQRFAVGNMNRYVDLYDGKGEQLAQLGGNEQGMTAVPAVAVWHPTMDWVAGGTASGKLGLWMVKD